jgi:hypothetical protein
MTPVRYLWQLGRSLAPLLRTLGVCWWKVFWGDGHSEGDLYGLISHKFRSTLLFWKWGSKNGSKIPNFISSKGPKDYGKLLIRPKQDHLITFWRRTRLGKKYIDRKILKFRDFPGILVKMLSYEGPCCRAVLVDLAFFRKASFSDR